MSQSVKNKVKIYSYCKFKLWKKTTNVNANIASKHL